MKSKREMASPHVDSYYDSFRNPTLATIYLQFNQVWAVFLLTSIVDLSVSHIYFSYTANIPAEGYGGIHHDESRSRSSEFRLNGCAR